MKPQYIYIISAIPKVPCLVDISHSIVASFSSEEKAQIAALKYDTEFPDFDHVIQKIEVKKQA